MAAAQPPSARRNVGAFFIIKVNMAEQSGVFLHAGAAHVKKFLSSMILRDYDYFF